jgi:hypothetical protein
VVTQAWARSNHVLSGASAVRTMDSVVIGFVPRFSEASSGSR